MFAPEKLCSVWFGTMVDPFVVIPNIFPVEEWGKIIERAHQMLKASYSVAFPSRGPSKILILHQVHLGDFPIFFETDRISVRWFGIEYRYLPKSHLPHLGNSSARSCGTHAPHTFDVCHLLDDSILPEVPPGGSRVAEKKMAHFIIEGSQRLRFRFLEPGFLMSWVS